MPQNTLLTGLLAPQRAATLLTGGLAPTFIERPYSWFYVVHRFTTLLANLQITSEQVEDGQKKHQGVRNALNQHYWATDSDTANSFLIGSWGKRTRTRPLSDIDILFLLPGHVYWRFQERSGNRQSQLLQEVKGVLESRYGQTTMRGDGQVVVVPFNSIKVEVSPGFRCENGNVIICDTHDNGSYTVSTAEAELTDLDQCDQHCKGNARALARMMKCWRSERNVPLKSFIIERLSVDFLRVWPHRYEGAFYYDWMIRDFFAYLISRANTSITMPGSGEAIPLGEEWLSRAQTGHGYALSACQNEQMNFGALAGEDWRNIFGSAVPVCWW